jgi:hypothetical protein
MKNSNFIFNSIVFVLAGIISLVRGEILYAVISLAVSITFLLLTVLHKTDIGNIFVENVRKKAYRIN